MDLILNVKDIYFQQVKSGEKAEEYRPDNDYWRKRLEGKSYDKIIYCSGYPKKNNESKRIIYPYVGWIKKTITHPHFGNKPVMVFAIQLRR